MAFTCVFKAEIGPAISYTIVQLCPASGLTQRLPRTSKKLVHVF